MSSRKIKSTISQLPSKYPVHLILLPFVFFVSLPVLFVKDNLQDITFLDWRVLAVLAVISAGFIMILLSINALFRKSRSTFILGSGAEFVLFFIVASGFIFPVSISTGLVEVSEVPVNAPNIFYTFVSAVVLVWVARSRHRQALYLGLIIFVALNTVLSGYAIISKRITQAGIDRQSLYEISDSRNIFVLSFDGLSGSAVTEVLQKNSNLASHFDGFSFFNHVVSSSPATSASTAASLYGNRDFKNASNTAQEMWDSSPQNLLTNYLNDNGYKVSTFGIYSQNFTEKDRRFNSSVLGGISVTDLINFTIARTLTGSYVMRGEFLNSLENILQPKSGSRETNEITLVQKIRSSEAPKWKNELTVTVLDLEGYITNIKTATSEPVAHFLHFTFTHYPVEFDRNCQFLGDDPTWYYARQNRSGVKEETYCALRKFSEFITKLKALKVFEKSLIILKSDHGKPVTYYNSGDIESLTIGGHPLWGYGRYAPFLAIKGFGNADFKLKEDMSPALLDDLAKTICDAALGLVQCKKYPGFNLLNQPLTIPKSAVATLFVVRSKDSDYKFKSHRAVTVKRQPGILKNLHESLSAEVKTD